MARSAKLGSGISLYNCDETVVALRHAIASQSRIYVCVANVHTTVTWWLDRSFQKINNGAEIATADGIPLVWASWVIGPAIHGRSSGPDILNRFLQQDTERNYRHFSFGSSPQVLESIRENIECLWPGTKIAGVYSPSFRPIFKEEQQEHSQIINQSKADIVLVGLGAPRIDPSSLDWRQSGF